MYTLSSDIITVISVQRSVKLVKLLSNSNFASRQCSAPRWSKQVNAFFPIILEINLVVSPMVYVCKICVSYSLLTAQENGTIEKGNKRDDNA